MVRKVKADAPPHNFYQLSHKVAETRFGLLGAIMKLLAAGGFVIVAAGTLYFFSGGQRPADQYAMPVSQAYAKIAATTSPQTETQRELGTKGMISGNGVNTLWYGHADDDGSNSKRCQIKLDAIDAANTHVTVECDQDAVKAGMVTGVDVIPHHYIRNRVIEVVDSALAGRAFSEQKAGGQTAYRWPGDGVGAYNHGQAVGEALKMDADMRKMQSEVRSDSHGSGFDESSDSGGDSGGE